MSRCRPPCGRSSARRSTRPRSTPRRSRCVTRPARSLSGAVTYDVSTRTATFATTAGLLPQSVYTATISGDVRDLAGNLLASDFVWSFTTGNPAPPADEGPGGPILVVSELVESIQPLLFRNPPDRRAERIHHVRHLAGHARRPRLVRRGPARRDPADRGAGRDAQRLCLRRRQPRGDAPGQAARGPARADGSIEHAVERLSADQHLVTAGRRHRVRHDSVPRRGGSIRRQRRRHDRDAVQRRVDGDRRVRRSPSRRSVRTAARPRPSPSTSRDRLSTRARGTPRGPARSATTTGLRSIRSDDLFFGAAAGDVQPDWVDLDKVAIPQADEQQRLLANLVLHLNRARKPLPRFWYLPRSLKAAIVMTGDDHAQRRDRRPVQPVQGVERARLFGRRLAVHPRHVVHLQRHAGHGRCGVARVRQRRVRGGAARHELLRNWTPASLATFYSSQIAQFRAERPSVPPIQTNRTHCIAWSDYVTQPKVELANGIRFDTNYYYFPEDWVQNRPGLFTGSAMPMRFADLDGTTIDVYQATTQMTDESGQTYPFTADTLLDRALGPLGYYGVFTANHHTDLPTDTAVGRDRRVGHRAQRARRLGEADARLARRAKRLVVRIDRVDPGRTDVHDRRDIPPPTASPRWCRATRRAARSPASRVMARRSPSTCRW